MNKINELFHRQKNILSIYFTAGFPQRDDTPAILIELKKAGADMIEIGIPFSDPLADGTIIQHSNEIALKNGMTLQRLFVQLKQFHRTGRLAENPGSESGIPLLLMGYLNPVLQFGVENFCKSASEAGISGVILPDLPVEEYLSGYKMIFEKYNLKNVFLITPQTAQTRIRMIDQYSDAFIYAVSSASTTGTKMGIDAGKEKYLQRMKKMKLKNPVMVGFGISDKESFSKACRYANGAIIGSAFIKALENKININEFVKSIR